MTDDCKIEFTDINFVSFNMCVKSASFDSIDGLFKSINKV